MNTIVKPILFVLTLPFTILTLGLFLFVLNAICLWIAALLVPGIRDPRDLRDGAGRLADPLAVVGMLWKALVRG